MREWPRSLGILAVTFGSVVAITAGLTTLIVQDRATSTADSTPTPLPTFAIGAVPGQTGASLTVSGDREAAFTLDRASYDVSADPDFERGFARVTFDRFGLTGDGGAIWFAPEQPAVEQIDYEGLAIYPEPDECTITPGELNPAIGVASARLECRDVTDLREGGTVTIAGVIAVPADMLGMRGDLPPSGGRIDVGDQVLEFGDGRVLVQDATMVGTGRQPLFLFGTDATSSIGLERDPHTGDLYLTYLVVDEELFDIDDEACDVSAAELGSVNPITTALDLSIGCEELDLGEHGVVTIDASLVIDLIVPAEAGAASR